MKIKELLYQTPEMTEEKLLRIMNESLFYIHPLKKRIIELHRNSDEPFDLASAILNEFDLIQEKRSFLTKSQRDLIVGFVGTCMIKMTKDSGAN